MTTGRFFRGPRELTASASEFVEFSYGDVAVLAPGAVDLLVPRLLERLDDHAARLGGGDDVVDHRPPPPQGWVGLVTGCLYEAGSGFNRVVPSLELLVSYV